MDDGYIRSLVPLRFSERKMCLYFFAYFLSIYIYEVYIQCSPSVYTDIVATLLAADSWRTVLPRRMRGIYLKMCDVSFFFFEARGLVFICLFYLNLKFAVIALCLTWKLAI